MYILNITYNFKAYLVYVLSFYHTDLYSFQKPMKHFKNALK